MRHSALNLTMVLAFGAVLCGAPCLWTTLPAKAADTEAWTMWKGDPQRTGASEASYALPLNLMWRHTTEEVNTSRSLYPPLVVGPAGDRRIYFVAGRTLFCINGLNGNLIWKSQERDITGNLGAPLTLLPGQNGDLVLALTTRGDLLAFRTSDGGRAWEGKAPGSIQGGAPVLINMPAGERIVVFTSTGRVVGFMRGGELDPKYDFTIGAGRSAITSTPALSPDGTAMFLTMQDQKLYKISTADGKEIYSVKLGSTAFESPLLLGDKVILSVSSTVRAYNQRTGNPLWSINTKGTVKTSPVGRLTNGGQGRLYFGTERGYFYAVDLNSGKMVWPEEKEIDKGKKVGNATILPDMILVGSRDDVLYALHPNDGRILWQYRMETQRLIDPVSTSQVTTDPGSNTPTSSEGGSSSGSSSTGSSSGESTGPAPTTAPAGPRLVTYGVSAAPIAVDGQLFVLGDNAALYAFESTHFDAVPPYASQPSLALITAEKTFDAFLLDPDEPLVVPGTGPLAFAVTLTDPGSGVVPDSIKVLVNAQTVPPDPKRMAYNSGTGVLSVNLIAPQPGQRPVLADGVYTIAVSAQDYRGNEMNYTGTFTVDRSAPAPTKIPPVAVIGGSEPGSGGPGGPGFGGPRGRGGRGSSGSSSPGTID